MARTLAIPATVAPPVVGNVPAGAEEAVVQAAVPAEADVLPAEEAADALPEDANEIKIEIFYYESFQIQFEWD